MKGQFPAQVVTHWGIDGEPDGWTSIGFAIVTPLLIGTPLVVFLALLGAAMKIGQLLGPMAVGSGTFIAITLAGIIASQRNDAAIETGWPVFLGLLSSIIISIAGFWFLRDRITAVPATQTGTFTPVAPGDLTHRRWEGRLRGGIGIYILGVLVIALGIVMIVLIRGDFWLEASLALVLSVVIMILFFTVRLRITIDDSGLRVRKLGLTLQRIALPEIRAAGVIDVEPLGEFGGYGYRVGLDGKREGLITGSGQALIIERSGHKDFVYTVEDASTAARTLATLAYS